MENKAAAMLNSALFFSLLLFIFYTPSSANFDPKPKNKLPKSDIALLEFPLNLEYLEAEFFLFGSLGYGLDKAAPYLTAHGPSPLGARKANLTDLVRDIVTQFAYQEVGHLRAIKMSVEGFPRPLLNLSPSNFANIIESAVGRRLVPPFDPYANDINYLIASYLIPYVGLTGYVGANPKLKSPHARRLVAGLLGVESAQDAVIRALLYEHKGLKLPHYDISVAEFTDKISEFRDKLGGEGVKDEGLVVPAAEGAEGKIKGNVIAGDEYSLAYGRTPREILSIVYGSGSAKQPGGLYPLGGGGVIARSFLNKTRGGST